MDRTYLGPAIYSLLLHGVLILAAVIGFSVESRPEPVKAPKYIEAVAVDEGVLKALEEKKRSALEAEKRKAQQAEEQRRARERAREEAQKERERQRKAEAAKKRAEAERRAEAARKAEAEKALALKKREEKKKQEDARRKKEEAKRKEQERLRKEREQQALLEKKRKQALMEEKRRQREARERQLLEESRRAQEEHQRRLQEEKQRAEEERLRQEALAAQQVADASEIDKYRSLIQQRIMARWHKPPSARLGMKAELRISLLPTGELLKVELVRSSGNSAFDNSAISAVKSVTRYPVPSDPRLFEQSFRHFTLVFNPKD